MVNFIDFSCVYNFIHLTTTVLYSDQKCYVSLDNIDDYINAIYYFLKAM